MHCNMKDLQMKIMGRTIWTIEFAFSSLICLFLILCHKDEIMFYVVFVAFSYMFIINYIFSYYRIEY